MKALQINIYKDRLQKAYLFGAPVLYSEQPIQHQLRPASPKEAGLFCGGTAIAAEELSGMEAATRTMALRWRRSGTSTVCGVYDMQKGALYLSVDILPALTEGKYPITTEVGSPIKTELCGKINQRAEDIIANDRKNLPVQVITEAAKTSSAKTMTVTLRKNR